MSNFEYYLQSIADEIRNPNDPSNLNDFYAVKDYVLDILRLQDSYFGQICQNDILFGSFGHKIRIYDDDEMDVLMELRFPAYNRIKRVLDINLPGFTFLDFSQACFDTMIDRCLANNKARLLCQSKLRRWINKIFTNALNNYGNVVQGDYEDYELSYVWRGETYTIEAVSPCRTSSIDFVPAVKFVDSKAFCWHGIPMFSSIPGNMQHYTFMISYFNSEKGHLNCCGQTLRDVLRLLQALRNSKKLLKLRCTHFVSLAIWLARRVGHQTIFHMSVSELFLMLLSDLCDAFYDGHLRYVWDPDMNLLSNFKANQLSQYHAELVRAYNILYSYTHQPTLSFKRCLSHFT